ncbi:GAF domain-containing protein [Pseudomarimonas salicorniae]|uniref:GAF domain-containing protein n=1 Tax=Pseudomarimonas salicorniae TaxID=2933270 RepID=A0ABT0GM26_9GAMM|nr:GAF domain-containing protein [Lysobacter sp. CAU 1642]MCK7595598.1 GAF domain-containing protein [Lysobacter sp. CAU 1642]
MWRHQSLEVPAMADARGDAFLSSVAAELRQLKAKGAPRKALLELLTSAAEKVGGSGAVVSIMLLDETGLLRNAAAPNLPADYVAAIDGLKPDPGLGTCCAAAATGEVVLTPDFLADDKWAELRHLPLSLGFLGAWSVPIRDAEGRVLGTLGTYFRSRRSPGMDERRLVEGLAGLAGVALGAE